MNMIQIFVGESPEKLPIVQTTNILSCADEEKYWISEIIAPVTLAIIIPKISREMLSLSLDETISINKVTPNAPNHAATTIPTLAAIDDDRVIPKAENPITNMATPKPAPELIPSM